MVFLIALLPALFVLVVGLTTKSKAATNVAAFIACLVGLAGGPAYLVIDLVAVAIAYGIAMSALNNSRTEQGKSPAPPPTYSAGPVYHKGDRTDVDVSRPRKVLLTESVDRDDEPWEVKRIKKEVADLFMSSRVQEVMFKALDAGCKEKLRAIGTRNDREADIAKEEYQVQLLELRRKCAAYENDAADLKARVFALVSQKTMSQSQGDGQLNTIAASVSKFRGI